MREYQQKHFVRTIMYSKVTVVVLFVLILLLLRSIMDLDSKRREVSILRDGSLKERQQVEEKVKQATSENDRIHTERGLEAYIRTTYPVVKDGEGVIVIYDDQKSPVSSVKDAIPLFEKIRRWFGNFVFGE